LEPFIVVMTRAKGLYLRRAECGDPRLRALCGAATSGAHDALVYLSILL